MSSFSDTVDLERAFLRTITTSIIMARMHMHQVKEEMFTSDERAFILALAHKTMSDTNSLLTSTLFDYEIKARVADGAEAARITEEWILISGISTLDPIEAVISRMKTAAMGRKTLDISESVIDLLEKGRIEEAVARLKSGAMMIGNSRDDRPLVQLTEFRDRLKLIMDKKSNPEKYMGIKTGFPTLDRFTGGLFAGELTLVAGLTGLGKSTFCRSLARNIVTLNSCKNVLHIANEEYLEQVQYKYDAVFTGIPYLDFKLAKIDDAALDRWQRYMQEDMVKQGRGQIFVKEVPANTDVSLIEQAYRTLENRDIHIGVIIIDHLPHVVPIRQAWGENDERAKAASDCKELARCLKVSVVSPTQASTDVEKKQAGGRRAGRLDVYGSKAQIHVSNTFIIITYTGTDDTQDSLPEYLRDVFWLVDAKKNRDGPPFFFRARHYVSVGRVEEVVTDDDVKDEIDKVKEEAKGELVESPRKESMEYIGEVERMIGPSEDRAIVDAIQESTEAIADGEKIQVDESGPPMVGAVARPEVDGRTAKSLLEKMRERGSLPRV